MKKLEEIQGFWVVVKYFENPPLETTATRLIESREFLVGVPLKRVWQWVLEGQISKGMDIESVEIGPIRP